MTDRNLDTDFADFPPAKLAEIEGRAGVGLHYASVADDEVAGAAFHHPEHDAAGTSWEPNWEPMDTYPDGDIVMLDDGSRQILGRREMGMWMELVGGDRRAQPDFEPMLWSYASEQVKYDMM